MTRERLTPQDGPARFRLPVRQLLVVLGLVATAYAAALLIWGDSPRTSLAQLGWAAGVQAASLCLLNYGLRGLRWRFWMAQHGRHFGLWQGLRLYLAGYAFTPTPGNVGEAVRGLMLAHQPLARGKVWRFLGPSGWPICCACCCCACPWPVGLGRRACCKKRRSG